MLPLMILFSCNKDEDDGPTPTVPTVASNTPTLNAIDVSINTTLEFVFSDEMDNTTINTTNISLNSGTNSVAGVVTYANKKAIFTPSVSLAYSTLYSATVSKGVKSMSGVALETDFVTSFTTSAESIPPVVTVTDPPNDAIDVRRNKTVSITFNEAMDPATINTTTFTLKQGTTAVVGVVTYSETTATFTANANLDANKVYTATVTTGAKDLAGNALTANTTWSFTTGGSSTVLAVVELGSAANYVILAKTAINNIPTSAITGDMGLSPAATSFITGFGLTDDIGFATSPQVTGKVYAADMASPTPINLTTAVENMITAYNDAAGRPTPDFLELGTGNIGGKTLEAGLYKWTTTVTLPSDVTISGGPDDVWIFQISGDLTQSAGVAITLSGGAQAKNIFWQVSGEATFGTTSHFEGNLLSMTGITFQTGASMNGRALAQTAVILDANAITKIN